MAGTHRRIAPPGEGAIDADGTRLDRNLAALSSTNPAAARAIAQAQPRPDLEWTLGDDGLLSCAVTDAWGRKTSLASRKKPGEEADRLARKVDIESAGVIVVKGFACGHHVRSILERGKSSSLIVVYEPDVSMLRAVLERQDHSGWLSDPLVAIVTDPDDAPMISQTLTGSEGLVSLGLKFVEHPPSVRRLADTVDRFEAKIASAVRAIRTNVITTLVQSDVTMRNQIMNLDRYAEAPGIDDLAGACAGRPAIVVSAGPSLKRNLHLLEDPRVREKFVIVAVQTVLKPLLARGIKPHFVTALDYHEISKRFYEGLTAEDVKGVTLVAEAKGNPAILDSWPGALRCPKDSCLSKLLKDLDDRAEIKPGATVAHLAYYLARHLGCDPVVLIGQDLAFTDGQYYASGAAIHDVWASEVGPFCTIETLEWQRIARMRSRLIPARDHLGRGVYTDEQMHTYRLQFERDFAESAQWNQTVIDATEGGVEKEGVRVMTLAEAIEAFGQGPDLALPEAGGPVGTLSLPKAKSTLRAVRADVWKVSEICRKTKTALDEMAEHHADQKRVNALISKVYGYRDEIVKLEPAYTLVQDLNQTGTLKRAKADRKIHLREMEDLEQQKAQIERDALNAQWLGEAADLLGEMMDKAIRAHDGKAPKVTREDPVQREDDEEAKTKRRVWAVIPADPWVSDLGIARDLAAPVFGETSALRMTLERLARTKEIEGAAIVTHNVGDTARAAGMDPSGGSIGRLRVRFIEADMLAMQRRRKAITGARAFSQRSWRGGAGGWTAYDEVFYPESTLDALEETGADAALLVGADWSLVDPALADEIAERFKRSPQTHKLVFSQAAVGLSPCLLGKSIVESVVQKKHDAGSFASIGSMLGYLPVQPMSDPIAGTGCVLVEPSVRDLGRRVTLDSAARRTMIAGAFEKDAALAFSAADIASALNNTCETPAGPEHLELELVGVGGEMISESTAISLIRQARELREDAAITLTAQRTSEDLAEVLEHPGLAKIIGAAKGVGVTVHVRTAGLGDEELLLQLPELGVDTISFDYVSDVTTTCELLTGRTGFAEAHAALSRLIDMRNERERMDGVHSPWIVGRLTRRDAIYEEIEPLYDRLTMAAGAAVIDPLPEPVGGERIEPFEIPKLARRVRDMTTLTVRADRTTACGDHVRDGIAGAWRRRLESLRIGAPGDAAKRGKPALAGSA